MYRNNSGTMITVDLTSSTLYNSGSQSDIQKGTHIAGYGTKNSDGSINAEKITINSTFPTIGQ
jgi:PDZ domain-containing secreted protein